MKTLLIVSTVMHLAKLETFVYTPDYSQRVSSRSVRVPFRQPGDYTEIPDKISDRSDYPFDKPEEYTRIISKPSRRSQSIPVYESRDYSQTKDEAYKRSRDFSSSEPEHYSHIRRKTNRNLNQEPLHQVNENLSQRNSNEPPYQQQEHKDYSQENVSFENKAGRYHSEDDSQPKRVATTQPESPSRISQPDPYVKERDNDRSQNVPISHSQDYLRDKGSTRSDDVRIHSNSQEKDSSVRRDTIQNVPISQSQDYLRDKGSTRSDDDRIHSSIQEKDYAVRKDEIQNTPYFETGGSSQEKDHKSNTRPENKNLFYPEDHRQEIETHDKKTEESSLFYPEDHSEKKKDEDNQVENAQNNTPIQAPDKCPEDQLLYNPGHNEVCDCGIGHIYYVPKSRCYPAYRQGPCRRGEYLIYSKETRETECVDNKCSDGSVRYKRKCYELDSADGPCPPVSEGGGIFGVNLTTLEIGCLVGHQGLSLFKVPSNCPPGSKRDIANRCRENFNV